MSGQYMNGPWNGYGTDRDRPAPGDPEAAYYDTGAASAEGESAWRSRRWYSDPNDDPANAGAWGPQGGYGGIPDSDPLRDSYSTINPGPWTGRAGYPYRRRHRGWKNLLLIAGLILLALLLLKPLAIAGMVLTFVFIVPLILLAFGLGIVGMILRLLFGWIPWGPWSYWRVGPPLFWGIVAGITIPGGVGGGKRGAGHITS